MLIPQRYAALPKNIAGRDFVVGDVHGQLVMLRRALDLVSFDYRNDRLIALGDLIDRGPDSYRLLYMLRDEPWFLSVRGNHEAMLRSVVKDGTSSETWDRNGNEWICQFNTDDLLDLADIIEGMPIAAELELPDGRRIGLVHAEVQPAATWESIWRLGASDRSLTFDERSLAIAALWGRTRAAALQRVRKNPFGVGFDPMARASTWEALQPVQGIDQIVSGHNIVIPEPARHSNHLLVDTGAYLKKGRLSIVELGSDSFWQVSNGSSGVRATSTKAKRLAAVTDVDPRWRPDAETLQMGGRGPDMDFSFMDQRPF